MKQRTSKMVIDWLLEPENPGVRYLALRDLKNLTPETAELEAACKMAYEQGAIAEILENMHPDGYWMEPGPGYNPKYRSTIWSIVLLAQLGASIHMDERILKGCNYLLEHAFTAHGAFSMRGAPSGTIDCLQGNLCWAMMELGVSDPRLENAYEWMARTLTGEGIASQDDKNASLRYYAGKCGPDFACGGNNKLPCAWGGTKVMLAFSKLPKEKRTPLIDRAIEQGVDFFLKIDPATAAYPTGYSSKPSGNWWKFGFPVFYITDLLQIAEALTALGYGSDPRLSNALKLIIDKQDEDGRWALEFDYTGKTWGSFGEKKKPNKWVTLRALRVLQAAGNESLPDNLH